MDRRTFTGRLAASLALPLPLSLVPPAAKREISLHPAPRRQLIPPRLRAGDTVGIVTPGSFLSDEGLERAVTQVQGLSLKVKLGTHIRAERGFLAGTDAERLEDLHAMFADEEVKAIWCGRGGYGCGRLVPMLDVELIRANPKILIGYSDITALLNYITRETGMVTYHGPVASSEFTPYTKEGMLNALMDGRELQPITLSDAEVDRYVIRPGRASGKLWGGNLSLLAAMAGTGYSPPVYDSLLFIEEIGEKPYRVDRMLTQLRQAWKLETAAGIMLGTFADCEADPEERSLTLRETLTDRLEDLGIPVAYGFSFGHIDRQCTLPVGMDAHVDTETMTIRFT